MGEQSGRHCGGRMRLNKRNSMEGPTPIEKGEQVKLKKKLETSQQSATKLENLIKDLADIQNRIKEEHKAEMAKPEWARRKKILEKLEAELRNNNVQLDSLDHEATNLESVVNYIKRRQEELERKREK